MKNLPLIVAILMVLLSFAPAKQAGTGPVATALSPASSADKTKVRGIYVALADITARDGGKQIPNLAVWRSIHASTLKLAVGGTSLVGKYDDLDKAVNEVLVAFVPTKNVDLTPEIVAKLVAGCTEVAKQSE